ncbi:Isoaspartyl peptidase or L-asparaginase, Ntn-hydrolase superfamily [Halanaeroarchaeum sp. HSR-CO]|nr:Isoaspartyl peptidase or L-asparaginase, Ntn-hydrolase superfamily [Halanaeroarchaeum sp. HSR-CO]
MSGIFLPPLRATDMRVIAHGGAGDVPAAPDARHSALASAVETGVSESEPLDAVVATIHLLESDPRFNAGFGSWPQSDGIARTDAGLMTDDREVGAACSMPGVEHAVSVARVVLEETPHVLVSGVHAVDLAADFGIETAVDLQSERTRTRWNELEGTPTGGPRTTSNGSRDGSAATTRSAPSPSTGIASLRRLRPGVAGWRSRVGWVTSPRSGADSTPHRPGARVRPGWARTSPG